MKEKFVINIGRQLGSGGHLVAEALAKRLGINFYDKQLIRLAAEQSGISPDIFERADEKESSRNFVTTLFDYLRAPFVNDDALTGNLLHRDALFRIQSDVIRDLATHESCIFVGRCADYILREHPRHVNLFISGHRIDRCRRVRDYFGIDTNEAEATIDRTDSRRAAYYNYYSNGRWGEAATYDLCIDSSALGIEQTTDFILEFVKRKLGIQ